MTLAERFCALAPDMQGAMADADNAKWYASMDDSGEVTFSDGSTASTLNGAAWEPRKLDS